MRRSFFVLAILVACAQGGPSPFERRVSSTIENAVGSVYSVTADRPRGPSIGAAFAVSERRLFTGYHVVAGSTRVQIVGADGTKLEARVVRHDADKDIALLEVPSMSSWLSGRSTATRVGQFVVALGSPGGYEHSASLGIISAVDREVGTQRYVQVDATLRPGSSGGPVLDLDGLVVGMTARGGADGGVAFLVPYGVLLDFLESELASVDGAEPAAAEASFWYLGAVLQPVTEDLAAVLEAPKNSAVVSYVRPGSPAEVAGVRARDVIVEIDVHRVETPDGEAIERLTTRIAAGSGRMVMRGFRRGRAFSRIVELTKEPPCTPHTIRDPNVVLIHHARPMCLVQPGPEYLEVARYWPRTKTTNAPKKGDLIVAIDGQEQGLDSRYRRLLSAGTSSRAVALVLRDGAPHLTVLTGRSK